MIDESQALYNFWSDFSLPAYDIYSVPDSASLPYITYSTAEGDVRHVLNLYGVVWYDSKSWSEVERKAAEINRRIGMDGVDIPFDGGTLHIARGTPPRQRYSQSSTDVKGIIINIQIKFVTT